MDLKGQRIVITGASSGIGAALARALAARGARLVLSGRDRDHLESVASDCAALGAPAIAQAGDVTKPEDCRALIDRTIGELGGIDVLVNNAGRTMWARFDALKDLEVFETLIRVNYLAAVELTKLALPALKESRGLIVAVASMAGLTGVPERTAYAASKHALVGFMDSLRIELRGSGVDVTVIAPDFVLSETHRRAIGADGRPLGTSPMQTAKIMTAEQCAARIVKAIGQRERLVITSPRGRFGRWLKLIAPGVIDRIAENAIRRRH